MTTFPRLSEENTDFPDAAVVINAHSDALENGGSPLSGYRLIGSLSDDQLGQTAFFDGSYTDGSGGFFVAGATGPPMVVAGPDGNVAFDVSLTLTNIPSEDDDYDYNLSLYITDATGENTLSVTKHVTGPTNEPITSDVVNLAGQSATIVGSDLTWDTDGAQASSTAGGIYITQIRANGGWD